MGRFVIDWLTGWLGTDRSRVPQVSILRPGTMDPLRAESEQLAAPQVLFFLFFDGALGVGEDFVGD